MTTIHDVEDFLALKRIAMVGVSRNPEDFSRALFREFCNRGYDMVPVNPHADTIEGRDCFQCLQVVKPAVEGVLVMTSFTETLGVVQDCAEAGIERVWLYRASGTGAVSPEAVAFCSRNGIHVVEGFCPYLFLPATGLLHRVHAVLLKLGGRYPVPVA